MPASRIESLPDDLRAIAEDMLAVKFPKPKQQNIGVNDFINATVTSTTSSLTQESIQKATDAIRNITIEYEREAYKWYSAIQADNSKFSVSPMWKMGVDFGY